MRIILNKKTNETVKKIHLLTTRLCSRKCPNCCNILYTDDIVPFVSDEELKKCNELFLTGGEPFQFTNPNEIAKWFKSRYKNIKKVIVYSNTTELKDYLIQGGKINNLDGISLSIKNKKDAEDFELFVARHPEVNKLKNNRLYVFNKLLSEESNTKSFKRYDRKWQPLEEYRPAPDSIFRRMI